jgi:hypothetical protein
MICIAFINILIKPCINLITKLEGWDFEHERISQVFIRTYIAGLLNNIFLVILYVEPLLETKYISWENLVVINLIAANKPKVRFASKEDFIASQFLKLVRMK